MNNDNRHPLVTARIRHGIALWMMVCGVLAAAITPLSASAAKAPDELVRETTEAFLADVQTNRSTYQSDNEKLFAMVNDLIDDRLDVERIGRLVLGKYWRQADAGQRERFLSVFRRMMVRTYATAIFEYDGQPIEYKPLKASSDADDVVVKTSVDTGPGGKVDINYAMSIADDGRWRIYDVIVGGVSLVTNYRASYSREIRLRGLDSLIDALEKKANSSSSEPLKVSQ